MNKITKVSAVALMATMLTPVMAEKVSAEVVGEYESKGKVTFKAGGGEGETTPPVDPTDPTEPVDPVDPIDPPGPGTGGPLAIDFASNWKFGTQTVTAQDATYYAHPQQMASGDTTQLYAQVTDTRGSFAGWSLSLKQEEQFKDGAGNSLNGAELEFTGNGETVSTSTSPAKTVTPNFKLSPGSIQPLLTAKTNEGTGTNIYSFGKASDYDSSAVAEDAVASKGPVQLHVAGGSMREAAYTTNLVWTLSDTPE